MSSAQSENGSQVPTLEDVAARAGVSTATVSRCLNTPDRVSTLTRDRVMAAVRELGYAPNFGARALAAKRTNTFGAIIPTMENAIFARGLQAFQEELGKHGITLLVASSSYSPELEEEQIRALIARGADALLLIGHDRTDKSYALLQQRNIPHVVAWAFDPSQSRLSIGFDNNKAMRALTREVLNLGHRSIAIISGLREGNDRARERARGALQEMATAGIPETDVPVIETHYGISNGADAFRKIMQDTPRPTAVLCGNDVLAAGALSSARQMGLRVPEDVSITGFDDIEIADIVTPPLTTVHVPHREMGRGAARLLLALSRGEIPGPSIELDAKVKWGESLGPVPEA
ncbi:LacI family DNA-binding transcriptional regulator [Ovoidimarina sediminis]|uniref:LacI family DNA-binding transcriptional regulator n=1 Tax=Ovoidimarina sediminis TaxID=3079856 RepID=UPI002909F677|nr:LacI family DNA-binding transcriptional regulator [Rhodophyticola sp. MJ-SS7]MDU8945295.1 LacI family DNA-binding transcriptional regulator [Rhodophyticola sp. MJ-SS7]